MVEQKKRKISAVLWRYCFSYGSYGVWNRISRNTRIYQTPVDGIWCICTYIYMHVRAFCVCFVIILTCFFLYSVYLCLSDTELIKGTTNNYILTHSTHITPTIHGTSWNMFLGCLNELFKCHKESLTESNIISMVRTIHFINVDNITIEKS